LPIYIARQADRQTGRQAGRQADRQADRQTGQPRTGQEKTHREGGVSKYNNV